MIPVEATLQQIRHMPSFRVSCHGQTLLNGEFIGQLTVEIPRKEATPQSRQMMFDCMLWHNSTMTAAYHDHATLAFDLPALLIGQLQGTGTRPDNEGDRPGLGWTSQSNQIQPPQMKQCKNLHLACSSCEASNPNSMQCSTWQVRTFAYNHGLRTLNAAES